MHTAVWVNEGSVGEVVFIPKHAVLCCLEKYAKPLKRELVNLFKLTYRLKAVVNRLTASSMDKAPFASSIA